MIAPEEVEAKLRIWGTRGYTDDSREYYRVPVEHIKEMKAAFKSILAALKEKDARIQKLEKALNHYSGQHFLFNSEDIDNGSIAREALSKLAELEKGEK